MKNVAIFEDGKIRRGIPAKLVRRGNKRVLLAFMYYNFDTKNEELVVEWFKLFIPSYATNKKKFKHNNKRKSAMYVHLNTNLFYSDCQQTSKFKDGVRGYYGDKYFNDLYGGN